jgi:hypothetical protein
MKVNVLGTEEETVRLVEALRASGLRGIEVLSEQETGRHGVLVLTEVEVGLNTWPVIQRPDGGEMTAAYLTKAVHGLTGETVPITPAGRRPRRIEPGRRYMDGRA